jgi:hypothetical protein
MQKDSFLEQETKAVSYVKQALSGYSPAISRILDQFLELDKQLHELLWSKKEFIDQTKSIDDPDIKDLQKERAALTQPLVEQFGNELDTLRPSYEQIKKNGRFLVFFTSYTPEQKVFIKGFEAAEKLYNARKIELESDGVSFGESQNYGHYDDRGSPIHHTPIQDIVYEVSLKNPLDYKQEEFVLRNGAYCLPRLLGEDDQAFERRLQEIYAARTENFKKNKSSMTPEFYDLEDKILDALHANLNSIAMARSAQPSV